MITIWTEEQVLPINLKKHLEDCGKTQVSCHENWIKFFTESGISVWIYIDEERKFLCINSYLSIDRSRSRIDKLDLIQRYNSDMFLPTFSLDEEEDVKVSYSMCYERGLIVGQFMIVLNRFCALIETIIDTQNQEGLIKLDQDSGDKERSLSQAVKSSTSADGKITLDGSRPKDATLN